MISKTCDLELTSSSNTVTPRIFQEALERWSPAPTGKRGGQPRFSDRFDRSPYSGRFQVSKARRKGPKLQI